MFFLIGGMGCELYVIEKGFGFKEICGKVLAGAGILFLVVSLKNSKCICLFMIVFCIAKMCEMYGVLHFVLKLGCVGWRRFLFNVVFWFVYIVM